jgi:hypothetical protein
MDRLRTPTEFGFPTGPYLPPEHPRPAWRTFLFGALLALIPFVGPGISAVYIDRRQIPSTYDFVEALKTALLQIVAVVVLAVIVWAVFGLLLGISIEVNPRMVRAGG